MLLWTSVAAPGALLGRCMSPPLTHLAAADGGRQVARWPCRCHMTPGIAVAAAAAPPLGLLWPPFSAAAAAPTARISAGRDRPATACWGRVLQAAQVRRQGPHAQRLRSAVGSPTMSSAHGGGRAAACCRLTQTSINRKPTRQMPPSTRPGIIEPTLLCATVAGVEQVGWLRAGYPSPSAREHCAAAP